MFFHHAVGTLLVLTPTRGCARCEIDATEVPLKELIVNSYTGLQSLESRVVQTAWRQGSENSSDPGRRRRLVNPQARVRRSQIGECSGVEWAKTKTHPPDRLLFHVCLGIDDNRLEGPRNRMPSCAGWCWCKQCATISLLRGSDRSERGCSE